MEWNIDPKCRLPFLEALGCYARERRRDGAYDWALFEDPAQDGRFIETFLTDSWLEHLRAYERVTMPIVCASRSSASFSSMVIPRPRISSAYTQTECLPCPTIRRQKSRADAIRCDRCLQTSGLGHYQARTESCLGTGRT